MLRPAPLANPTSTIDTPEMRVTHGGSRAVVPVAASPEPSSPQPAPRSTGGGRVPALVVSAIAIGIGNYAMSWLAVHFMPADQFARYAAAQGLLLVLGTGSLAAVPWAVARFVARRTDEREQSAGLHFGLWAAAVQAAALGGVQVLLAALGALDTVYVAAVGLPVQDEASYQAAALVARVPLFFSSAISVAVFARMAAARSDAEVRPALTASLRSFAWLAVPVALVCVTVPAPLLHAFVPEGYDQAAQVLRLAGFTGILVGVVNVLTTAHQARLRYRRCLLLLAGAVAAQAVALTVAGFTGRVLVFTAAGLGVLVLTTAAIGVDARRWLRVPAVRPTWWALPVAVGVLAAVLSRGEVVLWLGGVVVAGLASVALAFRTAAARPSSSTPDPRPHDPEEHLL